MVTRLQARSRWQWAASWQRVVVPCCLARGAPLHLRPPPCPQSRCLPRRPCCMVGCLHLLPSTIPLAQAVQRGAAGLRSPGSRSRHRSTVLRTHLHSPTRLRSSRSRWRCEAPRARTQSRTPAAWARPPLPRPSSSSAEPTARRRMCTRAASCCWSWRTPSRPAWSVRWRFVRFEVSARAARRGVACERKVTASSGAGLTHMHQTRRVACPPLCVCTTRVWRTSCCP
mmetsp:Transcript_13132/g.41930  ORF Transcript_13132/g.41930 Transcript_13132/m.41930 type:complete len:227 (+) Transcript_13132:126-806(+)